MNPKSVWAVLAGVIFVVVVTTMVDIVLHVYDVLPPQDQTLNDKLSMVAISYRFLIGMAGGALTALLAPLHRTRHAMYLGCVGSAVAIFGLVVKWNLGLHPHWYLIALVILAIPQSWLGAKLYVRGQEHSAL